MSTSQFTCQICCQGFEQKSRLERHILTSHPNPAPSAADVGKALSRIRFPKSKENIIKYVEKIEYKLAKICTKMFWKYWRDFQKKIIKIWQV